MNKAKALKILKIMFIVVITIVVLIAISIKLFYFWYSYPKYDEEEYAKFESYKVEFEVVNDYIIKRIDYSEEIVGVRRNGLRPQLGDIVSLYNDGDIELSEEIKEAFNKIDDAFEGYDFSYLEVTKDRISYGGLGYRMYVFSRNGKAPDYYYYPGDGMHHETFRLTDNWYLLTVHFI